MSTSDIPLPSPADAHDETGPLAAELARAYRRMASWYHGELELSGPEADQRARGQDWTPEEVAADLERIRERPPDQLSWMALERLVERDPETMLTVWSQVKATARKELASGWRTAGALDWDGSPWQRARFLAIRASLGGDTPSQTGVEAALVDMAAEAFSVWLEETEHAHILSSGEVDRERLERERHGGMAPPRLMMADAIAQATDRSERAHQRFLRTVKMLTELRRTSQPLYVAHAGQVNVGQQQVNLSTMPTDASASSGDLPKPSGG
jgi:hypothetical protein